MNGRPPSRSRAASKNAIPGPSPQDALRRDRARRAGAPELDEAAEVVDAEEVEELELALDPREPPGEAVGRVGRPVEDRHPPALPLRVVAATGPRPRRPSGRTGPDGSARRTSLPRRRAGCRRSAGCRARWRTASAPATRAGSGSARGARPLPRTRPTRRATLLRVRPRRPRRRRGTANRPGQAGPS